MGIFAPNTSHLPPFCLPKSSFDEYCAAELVLRKTVSLQHTSSYYGTQKVRFSRARFWLTFSVEGDAAPLPIYGS